MALMTGMAAAAMLALTAPPSAAQNLVALKLEGYPVSFQNGQRLLTVRHRPEKVLVFGLGPGELLIELGLSDLLVGRSTLDGGLSPLPKYAEAWASIPAMNPDKLASEEAGKPGPDFAYGHFGGDSPELGLEFLTVYASLATDKRGFFREVEELAAIFEAREKAEALIAGLDERLSLLSRRIAAREPVRVMVVRGLKEASVATVGGRSFASEVLRLGGALNVFSSLGASAEASKEEALRAKPDFIIVVNDGKASTLETISGLRTDPILSSLEAVSENKIAAMDETWLIPGPRLAEAAELVARTIHPRAME
jgi:iron complex transport system substrate-binding protein